MFKNFRKSLAVLALMATGVISQPANAGDKTDIILDVVSAVVDGRNGRDRDRDRDWGYNERWLCQTSSRGYVFRAEGRSQNEANYNVVNMCLRHPYGTNSECRFQVRCQRIGNGGGGGYPYPQPQPRVYTCQTHARGQWYRAQHRNLERAQRQALNQCYNYSGKPRQCDRNLQCGYQFRF